jgi:hypothetical protein
MSEQAEMELDGRTARLQQLKPWQPGSTLPPKACVVCGKLAKPLRRGLCNACNHRKRTQESNLKEITNG